MEALSNFLESRMDEKENEKMEKLRTKSKSSRYYLQILMRSVTAIFLCSISIIVAPNIDF